jgi:hypothetical protein
MIYGYSYVSVCCIRIYIYSYVIGLGEHKICAVSYMGEIRLKISEWLHLCQMKVLRCA